MPRLGSFLDFVLNRPPKDLEILEKPIEGRFVNTSRGGPNMPRYQFCGVFSCGLSSRRGKKTVGGAFYDCRRHGKFFVRAV